MHFFGNLLANLFRQMFFAVAFFAVIFPVAANAETRALLLGVWDYQSARIPSLAGPKGDLAAMEALANKAGATDVTVLANAQVTRSSIETSLYNIGRRSNPGDWVLLYVAGHGSQARAEAQDRSDGDLLQFVLLSTFDPDAQNSEQFVVDKDFNAWLRRYIPPNVQILMIADTCHSGTLNRAVDARAFHFVPRVALRNAAASMRLISRPAPRYPAVAGAISPDDPADLANLIFIAAAQDDQFALEAEMPVEGQPVRGVFTYSFERAFTLMHEDGRGLLADLDGNGTLSISEMSVYLDSEVRALTDERQQPRVSFVNGASEVNLFADISLTALERAARSIPSYFVDETGRKFGVDIDMPWRRSAGLDTADFMFVAREGALLRRSGDVVASGIESAAALRQVAEKWAVIEALRPYLNEARARLVTAPQQQGTLYAAGSVLSLDLKLESAEASSAAGPSYATVFNLASNGTVQLLYPFVPEDKAGLLDSGRSLPLFESEVVAPFGVDHVVALVTRHRPDGLRRLLERVNNTRAAERILVPLKAELLRGPTRSSLSIAQIRTGE